MNHPANPTKGRLGEGRLCDVPFALAGIPFKKLDLPQKDRGEKEQVGSLHSAVVLTISPQTGEAFALQSAAAALLLCATLP